jgi:hypothetical protein
LPSRATDFGTDTMDPVNQIFEKADFDGYVEALCQRFYANEIGMHELNEATSMLSGQ